MCILIPFPLLTVQPTCLCPVVHGMAARKLPTALAPVLPDFLPLCVFCVCVSVRVGESEWVCVCGCTCTSIWVGVRGGGGGGGGLVWSLACSCVLVRLPGRLFRTVH